ncbi:MAG: N-acetylmuramoyl-L-alanine amidase [Bacteroidales bacterium]|nr:N-acetylmuramoyl-L-alanine amidase [Bacteroidales bacterium]
MKITNKINLLPWHPELHWSERKLTSINKIIIHQELGEASIESVNQYHIQANHISKEGCPHFCYHYGIRKDGEVVQANELAHICWHTKGENRVGIGIMLCGNFKGPDYNLGSDSPTEEQFTALEGLTTHLKYAFGFGDQHIFGHYHFGKPACPGYAAEKWIESKRNNLKDISVIDKIKKTIPEIQSRLKILGYYNGEIDGIMGIKTQSAIREFQKAHRLVPDGIPGTATWIKLIAVK